MVERMDMMVPEAGRREAAREGGSVLLGAWTSTSGARVAQEVLGLLEEARGLRRPSRATDASRPSSLQAAAEAELRRVHADELAQATGLPRERFVIADGEYLSWHGSRTPDGIDYAEGLIAAARAEAK